MRLGTGLVAGIAAALVVAAPAGAQGFDHVGTFEVPANLQPAEPVETVTSAEIVAATPDGRTLIYTDSPAGRIGFVDVARPDAPRRAGTMILDGEPTSVATVGRRALVAVNTSESFTAPSGVLLVIDVPQRRIVRTVRSPASRTRWRSRPTRASRRS